MIIVLLASFSAQLIAQDTSQANFYNIADWNDTSRFVDMMEYGSDYVRTNPDSAIGILKRAVKKADEFDDQKWKAKALTNLGIAYGKIGRNTEALDVFSQVVKVNQSIGNAKGVASAFSNLGIVHKNIGDFAASLNYYFQALAIHDSIGNIDGKASVYANLGVIYDRMKDFTQSRIYYEKEIELKLSIGDSCKSCIHNLGLLSIEEGKLEEALSYLTEYLVYVREKNNHFDEGRTLGNIGHIYQKRGDYKKAEMYFNQSMKISRKYGMKREYMNPLRNIIEIRIEQKKLREAQQFTEEYLILASEQNDRPALLYGEKILSSIYEEKGSLEQALFHHKRYMAWKDSLHIQERGRNLQRWRTRLSVFEKEEEIQGRKQELLLLNKNRELEQTWRWILLIGLLLLVVVVFLLYQRNQSRAKNNLALREKNQLIETQNSEIERINRELEKRMLRAQINPHFIFNCLGSIQHFILSNERKSALLFLSKFSLLLRQSLENSVNINVVLSEEIHLLKTYLELEALRFDDKFHFQIETDENLDPDSVEVPVLLVQPYIENAILHGLLPKDGQRDLLVHFSEEGNFIICKIRDNGIGREAAALKKKEKKSSLGMSVTARRIALLYDDESQENAIEIKDLHDLNGNSAGTEITVRIPQSLH